MNEHEKPHFQQAAEVLREYEAALDDFRRTAAWDSNGVREACLIAARDKAAEILLRIAYPAEVNGLPNGLPRQIKAENLIEAVEGGYAPGDIGIAIEFYPDADRDG